MGIHMKHAHKVKTRSHKAQANGEHIHNADMEQGQQGIEAQVKGAHRTQTLHLIYAQFVVKFKGMVRALQPTHPITSHCQLWICSINATDPHLAVAGDGWVGCGALTIPLNLHLAVGGDGVGGMGSNNHSFKFGHKLCINKVRCLCPLCPFDLCLYALLSLFHISYTL